MRNTVLVLEVKISFTKTMCILIALFSIASGSMALTVVGAAWAKPVGIISMAVAVWLGFPASILAMLGKLHDDRGRDGMYSYLDDNARRTNDRCFGIYPTCAALLLVAASSCWIGYFNGFPGGEAVKHAVEAGDRGRILNRQDMAHLLIFCVSLCGICATFMAYVLREKGLGLAKLALAAALSCAILISALCARI